MGLENAVWLVVMGFIVAFLDGFGMGANDVSHSFGTSVGSGTLSMLQACTIAVFTEFLGAALLGSNNAKTISGLAKASNFEKDPGLLMLVMVSALLGSSIWTITSAKIGLPVSSTHSISGAVIGGVLILYGADFVNWSIQSGVGKIAISWVTSPIIAGIVSAIIYLVTRTFVLRHNDSYKRGKIAIPFYFSFTILIDVFLIMSKSALATSVSLTYQLVISAIACFASFIFFLFFFVPWIHRRVSNDEDLKWYHIFYIFAVPKQPVREDPELQDEEQNLIPDKKFIKRATNKISSIMLSNVKKNMHEETAEHIEELHDKAEKFDEKTERLYGYVQVLTAMFASLSHGAKYYLFI
eukprot:NODE_271_length_11194_cov_0.541595.p3 type:complete len:353 gc:universal NODE_271_length_11194_cov_0.541595:6292-7350(+)